MSQSSLLAISPIDGRYSGKTQVLQDFFSEFGLLKYRTLVEVEYFIALSAVSELDLRLSEDAVNQLREIHQNFSLEDAEAIKSIEKITNHDVKAVEYFLKEKCKEIGLDEVKEFIHFGLTSQDINNTAVPLSLKDCIKRDFEPQIVKLIDKLEAFGEKWKDIPMLAHTHGQPASPTRMGKEILVFSKRLKEQFEASQYIPYRAKFGGATGNFNAHHVAFPSIDWGAFGNEFIMSLGLERSAPTTQIEHYDHLSALLDNYKRICVLLIDLCRDIWQYISMNYFTQEVQKNEVGSSAMPHKVNPIDFENAEGNLGVAIALFEHLSHKLPISRLQRDLTDSTVLRNLGVPFGHLLVALQSLEKGLNKLKLNQEAITIDLEENWAVVAEAIQTILRREKYPNPYEKLKELTRTGKAINREQIKEFIEGLAINEEIKSELKGITPFNYTGI
jgi:adenylosuccinate lyase